MLAGGLELKADDEALAGRSVILVEGIASSPASIIHHADCLRRAGAAVIYAFAIEAPGLLEASDVVTGSRLSPTELIY